jgi:hypothetical protein
MKNLTVRSPQSDAAGRVVDRSGGRARVAASLLVRSDLGIRRIAYVGLQGREAIALQAAARAQGLHAEVKRSPDGAVSVILDGATD